MIIKRIDPFPNGKKMSQSIYLRNHAHRDWMDAFQGLWWCPAGSPGGGRVCPCWAATGPLVLMDKVLLSTERSITK